MPALELTPAARERIHAALARATPPRGHLRIEARVGTRGFEYRLAAASGGDISEDDVVFDQDGFRVVLDPETASRLDGARLDYRETLLESGFRFDNPNPPPSPALPTGDRQDLTGTIAEKVQRLLDTEINPAVAAHGGRVELDRLEDDVVYLRFGGGCHGCGLVDVTLKQGIETRIRELVPEISAVVDTTDHAAGETPFYRES
jgi:Fe/S biogenesis protein NfuA